MRPPRPTLPLPIVAALALGLAGPPAALELGKVEVQGLEDDAMRGNVAAALSLRRLDPARRAGLSESRLAYLLRRTPGEARQALEPFGYYGAEVELAQQRQGERVDVIVRITPGEPVRVGERQLEMRGEGGEDPLLQRRLQRFRPRSEEHTSELQSRENLVCRLLLEKKNKD